MSGQIFNLKIEAVGQIREICRWYHSAILQHQGHRRSLALGA